ncbi:GntR family transcriptional regulator [Labrenzia sp. PHM005]|uniref:GntR family transcriptional regulator n=1 Tax=Labrenzia sp. PHM005 TaxID=2590016 RepID=UPI00113FDA71|nr:GntR family transcriptional regulator [Labrenzia sp. PHM005]QDG75388.1 GntR family transcriptional regulator [Labrenzia sp. PHM005]
MTGFKRPKLLAQTVLDHLRNLIVQGDLKLGEAISERQLAERLQVSKTPVREALAQLRSEGLVQIFPQKGAFVFTLGGDEVAKLCDFRLPIEIAAAKLACQRDLHGVRDELAKVVCEMRDALSRGDTRAYLDLDTAFHSVFLNHCGNPYLVDTYKRFAGKIAALRTHLAVKPFHTKLSMQEHEEILESLDGGSITQTINILSHHIDRTRVTYSVGVHDIAAADFVDVGKAS